MKYFLSTFLLVFCVLIAHAAGDQFSYLYIQGDKQTPFYVKLEDAMQPRFGKNYCIIPKMAPGPAHIEILFQQNAYPAQKFTVLMPEGGNRGFLLVKKEDSFMLYDLQQGFYLPAGNIEEDDRMPASNSIVAAKANEVMPIKEQPKEIIPEKHQESIKENTAPLQEKQEKTEVPAAEIPKKDDGTPVFIPDLELSKDKQKTTEIIPEKTGAADSATKTSITNTDCPAPLSSTEFSKIFSDLTAYKTDEDRLEYITWQMNLCYETWQARTLAGKLEGDAARYELLRKIYPRITDQSAFPLLDDLLTSEVWKAEFSRLVHPK